MIAIPRSLVRQLRSVFRRLVQKSDRAIVSLKADRNGLRVRLHTAEIQAEYRVEGSYASERMAFPFDALAAFEGKGTGQVTLELTSSGVQAKWDDGAVPQVRDFEAFDRNSLSKFPDTPKELVVVGPNVLNALCDASLVTAREGVRYATHKIQLRGRKGEIVSTDGHQLLVQSGFQFPFTSDLIIPSSKVFKDLEGEEVQLAADKHFVTLQAGPWTLHLPIDTEARYPRVDEVIPKANGVTRCTLSTEDATFLSKSLSRLPGGNDENSPVTMDLNGQVIVRARGSNQPKATEVVLAGSQVSGKAVRWNANRDLVGRALDLGFTMFDVLDADSPVACRDSHRTYVFMPLLKKDAIPPSEDALRIHSSGQETATSQPVVEASVPAKRRSRPIPSAPVTESNGDGEHDQPVEAGKRTHGSVIHELMEEASALRDVLRDAYTRTHHLMSGLQRHKKQSQAVKSTLASLRQLQQLAEV